MKIWGAVAAALLLTACAADREPPSEPAFYVNMTSPGAKLDSSVAASMISGYRQNNGLSAVSVDPKLTAMAEEQSAAMAKRDKLDHNVSRPFNQRMKASGFDASIAVENILVGEHTLAQAFSTWRDSPSHRANMLKSGVNRMGIAAVYAPNTKYKVFWTLVLAAPDAR